MGAYIPWARLGVAQLVEAALVLCLGALLASLQAPYLAGLLKGAGKALLRESLGQAGQALLGALYESYTSGSSLLVRPAPGLALHVKCEPGALTLSSGDVTLKLGTHLPLQPCDISLPPGGCVMVASAPLGMKLTGC